MKTVYLNSKLDNMKIEGTKLTPNVLLTNSTLELSGTSVPENSVDFYKLLIENLVETLELKPESFTFNIFMEYFNTSSASYILQILRTIEGFSIPKKEVNWLYLDDDEDMLEAGQDYSNMVPKLKFNFLPKEDLE